MAGNEFYSCVGAPFTPPPTKQPEHKIHRSVSKTTLASEPLSAEGELSPTLAIKQNRVQKRDRTSSPPRTPPLQFSRKNEDWPSPPPAPKRSRHYEAPFDPNPSTHKKTRHRRTLSEESRLGYRMENTQSLLLGVPKSDSAPELGSAFGFSSSVNQNTSLKSLPNADRKILEPKVIKIVQVFE